MLGGWSISSECAEKIGEVYPFGTILELGSGEGTKFLSRFYDVYSIEHDENYVGKYDSTYIYAPIVNGWYDVSRLQDLPNYGLLLIDGPPATIKADIRLKFLDHVDLFNLDAIIVLDDVQRAAEMKLADVLSEITGRKMNVYGTSKKFAVI